MIMRVLKINKFVIKNGWKNREGAQYLIGGDPPSIFISEMREFGFWWEGKAKTPKENPEICWQIIAKQVSARTF